jgi:hypothetical protein
MKKRKLSKLVRGILTEINESRKGMSEPVSPMSENDYNYTQLDDKNKKKIRDLILGLSKKRDEFQIRINEWSISLNTENLIPINSSSKRGTYFNIEIVKDVGFHIHCNDRRVMMKDENLYADILPKMKEIFDEINITNFNDVYSSIMIDNGLIRDANLNELLSSL